MNQEEDEYSSGDDDQSSDSEDENEEIDENKKPKRDLELSNLQDVKVDVEGIDNSLEQSQVQKKGLSRQQYIIRHHCPTCYKFDYKLQPTIFGNNETFLCDCCRRVDCKYSDGAFVCKDCNYERCSSCQKLIICRQRVHNMKHTTYWKDDTACIICLSLVAVEKSRWECKKCEINLCQRCYQDKACPKRHPLQYNFVTIAENNQGEVQYEDMNYDYYCQLCRKMFPISRGAWCCIKPCLIYRCTNCYLKTLPLKNRRKKVGKLFDNSITNQESQFKPLEFFEKDIYQEIKDNEMLLVRKRDSINSTKGNIRSKGFISGREKLRKYINKMQETQQQVMTNRILSRFNQIRTDHDNVVKFESSLKVTEDQIKKLDQQKFYKSHFDFKVFMEYFLYYMMFYFFLGPLIAILFQVNHTGKIKLYNLRFLNPRKREFYYQLLQFLTGMLILWSIFLQSFGIHVQITFIQVLGPVMCIIYRALIQACIYSTVGKQNMQTMRTVQLTDTKLREFGLDFWLSLDQRISDQEFSDTFQRNDLDIIITWVKFFGSQNSKDTGREKMLEKINEDTWYTRHQHANKAKRSMLFKLTFGFFSWTANQIKKIPKLLTKPSEPAEGRNVRKRVKITLTPSQVKHKKEINRLKEFEEKRRKKGMTSTDNLGNSSGQMRKMKKLKAVKRRRASKVTPFLSSREQKFLKEQQEKNKKEEKKQNKESNESKIDDQILKKKIKGHPRCDIVHKLHHFQKLPSSQMADHCRKCRSVISENSIYIDKSDPAYKCDVCFDFIVCEKCFKQEQHFFTYEICMLRKIMSLTVLYQIQEYKSQFLENNSKVVVQFQKDDMMHISNIAKYFLMSTQSNKGTTKKIILVFLVIRTIWELTLQYNLGQIQTSWSSFFLILMEVNNFMLTFSIFCFLQRGNDQLEQKRLSMCHFTQMISQSNQKYSWEPKEKLFNVINFLDPLSLVSYGKLRKLLLDFGDKFTHRMQIIYSTLFILVLTEILVVLFQYYSYNTIDRYNLLQNFTGRIIPFYMLPLAIIILQMLYRTAQINEFFQIQIVQIQKLKFIICMLANLPFKIYFKDDPENEQRVTPHNEKLDFIISYYKKKYKKNIQMNCEYYEFKAQEMEEDKQKMEQEQYIKRLEKKKRKQQEKMSEDQLKKEKKDKKKKNLQRKQTMTMTNTKIVEEVKTKKKTFDFVKMQESHKLFKDKIKDDLKQLIQTYNFLLDELTYDSQNNLLTICQIPVTFSFLINLMVPIVTMVMTMMQSIINQIITTPASPIGASNVTNTTI